MKALSAAIYAKISGSFFSTAIGGRFYKGRAPENATYPYAVFSLVSDDPGRVWGADVQDSLWQFDLYSSTSSSSEVEDLYIALKALYDDCTLTVTGATFGKMERQHAELIVEDITQTSGEAQIWHYAVDYNIVTVKSS